MAVDTTTENRATSWDRWFHVTARGSSNGREVRGGLVTFFTMAYIVVLNPLIIGTAKDQDGQYIGGSSIVTSIAQVTAATALCAGVITIAMGIFGRFPVALAAGLGINGVVAFALAPQMSWADAMGIVVLEGVIISVLVLTGFRTAVFHAVPEQLKYAIGVGIGLFITIIGFVDAGITRTGNPLITFGDNGALRGWPAFTFVFGLLLTAVLVARKVRGAILIGLVVTTLLSILIEAVAHAGPRFGPDGKIVNPNGWSLNVPSWPSSVVASPNFGAIGHVSLFGGFAAIGVVAASLAVFSLMLSDFFDTMGTVFGLANEGEILTESGEVPHFEAILLVDSLAAVAGGVANTSSNTSYIESASGVGEGARTGVASLATGALFLVAMFFSPLVTIVPHEAAAPALVIVGFLMMTQIRHIDFTDYEIGIPAFLTMVLMPFTYSITNGIGAGFVTYCLIKAVNGRAREVPALLWVVSAAFVVYFAYDPITQLLHVG